jgi:hypothetical protein
MAMSLLQAFALGAMVALTPSLIFVAWLLWRTRLIGLNENNSSGSKGMLRSLIPTFRNADERQ